ncbi:MAG: hypothetical protein U9P37_07115 [Pseudomonadota bacterium]|nr:hypothetical protein [Pseudomonadota bacterium]
MVTLSWLFFLLAAVCVLYAGRNLTQHSEELAEQTGLAHGFIGVILLGFITSLPELVSTIGASTLVHSPNLALGNIFGSNSCNLAILAMLGIANLSPEKCRYTLNNDNLLTAFLSLIMVGLASLAILIHGRWQVAHIDYFSLAIVATYLAGLKILYNFQRNQSPANNYSKVRLDSETQQQQKNQLKRKILSAATIIVIASLVLSYTAGQIARSTGWGNTFVGNFFLAIATSLPEMAVTFSAIRLGSFALAAGNIFGSNIFNIAILTVADLLYFPGSLYANSHVSQILVTQLVILLSSIYLFFSLFEIKRRLLGLNLEAISIVTIYALGMYVLFIIQ